MDTKANVPAFLVSLAGILGVEKGEVTVDFPLEKGNWDSVAILSTIALIDERFGITLSGDALQRCTMVRDILALV